MFKLEWGHHTTFKHVLEAEEDIFKRTRRVVGSGRVGRVSLVGSAGSQLSLVSKMEPSMAIDFLAIFEKYLIFFLILASWNLSCIFDMTCPVLSLLDLYLTCLT